jgi:hypothetical protein
VVGATREVAPEQLAIVTKEVAPEQPARTTMEGSSFEGEAEEEEAEQPYINFRLVEFYFHLDDFLYELTNLNFTGCDESSWLHLPGLGRSGLLSGQWVTDNGRMSTRMARVTV